MESDYQKFMAVKRLPAILEIAYIMPESYISDLNNWVHFKTSLDIRTPRLIYIVNQVPPLSIKQS